MEYELGCFGVLDNDIMKGEPLKLLDGGMEKRCRERYDFDNLHRPGYQGYLFQYTLEGEGCLERDGKKVRLTPGKGFMVRFPEESRYYLPKGGCWEFIYLHFEGTAAASFIESIWEHGEGNFTLDRNSRPIQEAFQLHSRLSAGKRLAPYEGGEFLYGFLCGVLRELQLPSTGTADSPVSLAAMIMEKEYNRLTGISELAGRLGVSCEHLTRSFHQQMGIAPIRFLTEIRLQAAVNELLNTEDSIERIACRTGFSCGNYFCKVFRRNTGMSPMEYRRSRKSC